ncbi:sterol carrier protein domain-containing protein [Bacillus cabrialesii subsp. cabrialesii]|uniref:sterol carrier protein domain-containing protein n=1 Tax=Bacillus cabrialesii TaxID=2487276 RepID=UPI0033064F49
MGGVTVVGTYANMGLIAKLLYKALGVCERGGNPCPTFSQTQSLTRQCPKTAKLDIQTVTALLFAYRKPEYLHRIGRLDCSLETLELIEDLLETQTPYFSVYF